MKVAIVHDSIGEFGGAERVVLAISEMFPDAPIYTSFARGGEMLKRLKGKRIITSWAQNIPFFSTKLHSPLRFLAPLIWGSFDFSKYDLVISSASWYITKGFGSRKMENGKWKMENGPVEVCYIHTPPRWLYGYDTPLGNKNIFVRVYKGILAHFMRMYDFNAAQRVNYFIANSENVAARTGKFYRREAKVIYPPIETWTRSDRNVKRKQSLPLRGKTLNERNYYLIISRITGGKGIEMAVRAAKKGGFKLKIAGGASGYSDTHKWLLKNATGEVCYLGYVTDEEQAELYAGAKGFLALERDVDFGMTPVEAQATGTPVIAYNSGGYPESVIDPWTRSDRNVDTLGQKRGHARTETLNGATGILFDEYSVDGLIKAIKRFERMKFDEKVLITHAKKFSKERFKREILGVVNDITLTQFLQ